MSKATNPGTEVSVSCGFFNSVIVEDEPDRLYNAEQMSAIFDGLINDGIFASIGDTLIVTADSGNKVFVGTGKCWFNHTWTLNDADMIQLMSDVSTELDNWTEAEKNTFLAWFDDIKDQLSEDSAGKLQLAIDKEEISRIMLFGFNDGVKDFSEDGTTITSVSTDGMVLIKTFSDNFTTVKTVLKSSEGAEIANAVKTFDTDGKHIDQHMTYYSPAGIPTGSTITDDLTFNDALNDIFS